MPYNVGELIGTLRILGAQQAARDITTVTGGFARAGEAAGVASGEIDRNSAALTGAGRSSQVASRGAAQFRAAQLSAVAATERYNTLLADESVQLGRLASAEAAVIRANERVRATTPVASIAAVNKEAAATPALMAKSSSGFLSAGKAALGLGAAFGAFEIAKKVVEFVGAGKELTTALNGVQAAAHASDGEMKEVRAQAIGMGKDLTIPAATAVDAADAINDLVRSGMTLPRALAASRSALLLASAAQVSTADSARFLGDTLDDFGLQADQAAHVANVLAGGATSAGGGLSEMFQALKYAGPVARAAHTGVDTLVASITELAKGGIIGDQAGTGLRSMLLALAGPTKQQAAGFKALGIQTKDAAGNLIPLPDLFDQLHKAQERMTTGDFLAAIKHAFGKPATSVVAAFAHQGIAGYDAFAKKIESGDVQKYADLMNRGVKANLAQLRKEFTAAGIDVYDKFEPKLAGTLELLLTSLPAAFHIGAQAVAPFIDVLRVAGAVIGPVAGFIGDLLHDLGPAAPIFGRVASAAAAMFLAFKGYGLARTAIYAILDGLAMMQARAANSVGSIRSWAAGNTESMKAVAVQSASTTALMKADLLAQAEADLNAAAAKATAAAEIEAAYALEVSTDEESTAAMVASAEARAAAFQASADAAVAAAAEIAGSAEAAAAAVATAGEEASVGWAGVAGPIAAVGVGLALLVPSLRTGISLFKQSTISADTYTAALQQSKGAINDQVIALTTQKLASDGVYAAATKYSISQDLVTRAALGSTSAQKELFAALHGNRDALNTVLMPAQANAAALKDGATAYKDATRQTKDHASAATSDASATDTAAAAMKKQTSEVDGLVKALQALGQTQIAAAQSEDQLKSGILGVKAAVKENGTALNENTKGGLANRDMLLSLLSGATSLANAQYKNGASIDKVSSSLQANVKQIEATAIKAGLSQTQVDKLVRSMGLTPKDISTKFHVDYSQARAAIAAVSTDYAALAALLNSNPLALKAYVNVGYQYSSSGGKPTGKSAGGGRLAGLADGGTIPGSGDTDSYPAMLMPGEEVTPKRQAIKYRPLLKAIAADAVPGYAGGGTVTKSGKSWVYGGIKYASREAAQNAQTRSNVAQQKAASTLVSINIPGLTSSLAKSVDSINAATKALVANARAAGASSGTLRQIAAGAAQLGKLATTRDQIKARLGTPASTSTTAYDRLNTARDIYSQEKSSVASAITGQFDLTKPGGNGIQATIAGQINSTAAFLNNLKTLQKRGLDATDLADLAGKGPAASADAVSSLLKMSGGQLKAIGTQRTKLSSLGNQLGDLAASGLYGGQVAAAQKQVTALIKQEQATVKAINALGLKIEKQVPQISVYVDGHAQQIRAVAKSVTHR